MNIAKEISHQIIIKYMSQVYYKQAQYLKRYNFHKNLINHLLKLDNHNQVNYQDKLKRVY